MFDLKMTKKIKFGGGGGRGNQLLKFYSHSREQNSLQYLNSGLADQ